MIMKKIITIAATALLFGIASCQSQNKSGAQGGVINTTISVDEFEKKLTESDIQIVDVRTPEEFEQGHIKGAKNININGGDFEAQLNQLDKNKTVLVYCLSGGRSSSAAGIMEDKGFKAVYNMSGGMMKWNGAGKAVETGNAPVSEGMSLEEFNKLVNTDKYVLVDYNAKWCVPCKKMAPMLEKIAQDKKDKLILVKIDADENQKLVKQKGVDALPVLELYQNGKVVWKHDGLIDEATLLSETKL